MGMNLDDIEQQAFNDGWKRAHDYIRGALEDLHERLPLENAGFAAALKRECEAIRLARNKPPAHDVEDYAMHNPRTAIVIAVLCDAIKRLEWAIAESSPGDRQNYLDQCAKRRKQLEDKILGDA